MLPNEARKILCNRTATGQLETKRVVWRWNDDICDDEAESAGSSTPASTPGAPGGTGGHEEQQTGSTATGGAQNGEGGGGGGEQSLGNFANEAVERLALEGRGRRTGDGAFVRSLQLGDVVTVWAKARFPHWVNHVARVTVDVYFAV